MCYQSQNKQTFCTESVFLSMEHLLLLLKLEFYWKIYCLVEVLKYCKKDWGTTQDVWRKCQWKVCEVNFLTFSSSHNSPSSALPWAPYSRSWHYCSGNGWVKSCGSADDCTGLLHDEYLLFHNSWCHSELNSDLCSCKINTLNEKRQRMEECEIDKEQKHIARQRREVKK